MPQNLLIIDDSPPLHELVKVHMGTDDFAFESAFSGAQGLTLAAEHCPDLILLDVDMPDMSGFAVCRALKSDAVLSRIPVIFLTAASSTEEKVCGLDLQAADYVTKPFDPEELLHRVRAALRTKRLLDLLPPGGEQTTPALQPNNRLSFAQLQAVRSTNPWKRRPPVAALG